ncbi:hypothetical protein Q9Q95_08905 [Sphingomonas sp. DG1-23]|uniref:hypothetical protein n=1 Tax=Sphingomonas sp. DG1-23 TaxID=3068316 RepID=UPI00273CFDAE|nr:hypothetical protein [Sphingomonas sp. DG1-23]MDP5279041.1 hypothetical protein [Sphingomonas sp. DG1-23]
MIALLAYLLMLPAQQGAPVVGPGQLCLKYSSFALAPGERVVKRALDIENMQLQIDGPHGQYIIVESELMGGPESRHQLLQTRRDARIYSLGHGVYAFRGKLPFTLNGEALAEPEDKFFVSIRGDALNRERSARRILSRLKLGIPAAEPCIMRYRYGWEYFLPPETE